MGAEIGVERGNREWTRINANGKTFYRRQRRKQRETGEGLIVLNAPGNTTLKRPEVRAPMSRQTALLLTLLCALSCEAGDAMRVVKDVPYATVGERVLRLDLYLPSGKTRAPLIVWVHGGAWRSGSKNDVPIRKLVAEGYAIASVDYRLSTEARFPAQIHDIKAAIRFLRGHASEWQLSAKKIVIAGDSAGAHLAALVGVSNGNRELEGELGDNRTQSSSVEGIISFYGAANLQRS